MDVKYDIYKELRKNRWITKIVLISATLIVLAAMLIVYLMHQNHDKYVYGLSKDKSLLPLELIEKEEQKETFKKGHILYFIQLFYTIDQFNYKNQIEKSLWLIDSSGKTLYQNYTSQGHYNRIIQTSSNQYVNDVDMVFDNNDNFKASAILTISKPNQEDPKYYRIIVEGKLAQVKAHYPENPYGYIITNFREINKTEIPK